MNPLTNLDLVAANRLAATRLEHPRPRRRQRLFDVVRSNPSVFEGAGKLGPKWSKVFNRPWLKEERYDDADQSALEDEIRRRWAEFLEKDLPRIDGVLKGEPWIWEPDGSSDPT